MTGTLKPSVEEAVAHGQVESPWRAGGEEARARRWRLLIGVLAVFAVVSAFFGFPTGREVVVGWVLLLLFAACAGDVRLWRRVVVRDWLPLIAVLFAYDLLRGFANEVGGRLFDLPVWRSSMFVETKTARAHLTEPIEMDRALFGGTVPTEWLQQRMYDAGEVHWYDVVAFVVYFSHFLVSLALAVALWATAYSLFRRYLASLVALTVVTLVTYTLYPAAPPWMASLNGELAPGIARIAPETLRAVGGHTVNSAIERGEAYSNPVAAIPSLHAAIPMMLLLFCWPVVGRWLRAALVSYSAVMAWTLVYGGEHYVVDVLIGWLYAAAAVYGVRLVVSRREARRDRPPGAARSRTAP
jgi:membrane-associated phospholipid phosphatase